MIFLDSTICTFRLILCDTYQVFLGHPNATDSSRIPDQYLDGSSRVVLSLWRVQAFWLRHCTGNLGSHFTTEDILIFFSGPSLLEWTRQFTGSWGWSHPRSRSWWWPGLWGGGRLPLFYVVVGECSSGKAAWLSHINLCLVGIKTRPKNTRISQHTESYSSSDVLEFHSTKYSGCSSASSCSSTSGCSYIAGQGHWIHCHYIRIIPVLYKPEFLP